MFYRWEDPYSNWELDFKQCSFDRAVRILHHLPFNIFRISMLFSHALVPPAFRLQVSAMIQESPSKFFLTASGILKPRHAAHSSKLPTGGVLMPPLGKKPGRLSRNGSGTYAWNWVMCLSRRRCARPSLLLPPKRPPRNKGLCKAMASLRLPCPGKRIVSRGRTSSSNPTGCCTVQMARRCAQLSSAGKPMAVCACSTALGSSIVAAAQSVRSVNGMGKPPRSRVASVYCCIRSRLVPRHCGFAGLEPQRASACLYAAPATPTHRGEPAASRRRFAAQHRSDPVSRPCSPLVERRASLATHESQQPVR